MVREDTLSDTQRQEEIMKKNPYKSYMNAQKKSYQNNERTTQSSVQNPEETGEDEGSALQDINEEGNEKEQVNESKIKQEEEKEEEKSKAIDEDRLRLLADLENTRKRLFREKEEAVKFASENLLKDLLPTLDNLDLALNYGKKNPACKDLLVGMEMTKKQLLDTLEKHGLVTVGNEGEPFDPQFHEAMSQEEREDMPSNHISQLFQKGYLLKDRLIRPAKVVVSKKPEDQ